MKNESPLVAKGRTLGVIGAGVMGRTLLRGLLDSGLIAKSQAWASAKTESTCETAARELGVPVEVEYEHRLKNTGLLLICVKPAQAGKVLAHLRESGLPKDTLMVSIMAGLTSAQLEDLLGTANPWIRAMPNTPCIVREGITVICAGTHAARRR